MWQGIHGHDSVVERFRHAHAKGRVGGTYLLVGPEGVGKRSMAVQLAKAMLCLKGSSGLENSSERPFDPCGTCDSCRMIDSENHPDLDIVYKRKDRQQFTVDLLVGSPEKRNREGLLVRLAVKPGISKRKVAILNDADLFNRESANTLLKTLEEPPAGAVIFLIGTSQNRQLPTIRSRSQVIRFKQLPESIILELLQQQLPELRSDEAEKYAASAEGSISKAIVLASEGVWAFREHLFGQLAAATLEPSRLAKDIFNYVKQAGSETKKQRVRLRQVMEFALEFYRELARQECGAPGTGDRLLQEASARSAAITRPEDATQEQLELCLEALMNLNRNANVATLIEWWTDSLAA